MITGIAQEPELVAEACELTAMQHIEFIEWSESNKELNEQQQKILNRAWLAMAKLEPVERRDVLTTITALRQARLHIRFMPRVPGGLKS